MRLTARRRHDCEPACVAWNILYPAENQRVSARSAVLLASQNVCSRTVYDIVYPDGAMSSTLPICVLVEFDEGQYNGPTIDIDGHKVVPIVSQRVEWQGKNGTLERQQLPLMLSWAMTIHKSQGQTIKKGVVNLGKREMNPGLSFVAFSRFPSPDSFLVHSFGEDRLQGLDTGGMKRRRTEERRLRGWAKKTLDPTMSKQFTYRA